jgi:predicted metal-binding membrane protein
MGRLAEGALRRHRAATVVALVLLVLIAWAWLATGAGMAMGARLRLGLFPHLDGPQGGMAMEGMAPGWGVGHAMLTFSMWWVMMVAMMIPAAAATILLYARVATHSAPAEAPAPRTGLFLLGYLVVWALFSAGATALHAWLERSELLAPDTMGSASRWLSGALLLAAGLYQLSPAKNACLSRCRSPAEFLTRHYRPGRAGALRLGLIHGAYCAGCCWLLMALLFVGGVMNLAWIAVLTLLVAAEKLLPQGRAIALVTGLALLAWGVATLLVRQA